MRGILKGSIALFILFFGAYHSQAQVFWTETFGSGCNIGTLANGFTSTNGVWQIDAPAGNNGTDANVWYISAAENGEGVGNCGAGCGTNPTLHISAQIFDLGAAYLSSGNATTDTKAISPVIDCSGKCGVDLSFEYIENGDGANDNLIIWYYDGALWTILEDTPKTPFGACAPQGMWASRTISLPASADNNPDVQIGFQWVNNADAIGTDPSAAIYNIQMASVVDNVAPTITCVGSVNVYVGALCEGLIPMLNRSPEAIVSDNCTPVDDLIVTQNYSVGTPIVGHNTSVTVTITVEDLAGNTNTCDIDVIALDTVAPVLTCLSTQNVSLNASCTATLGDYLSIINAGLSDNCSANGDIVLQQTPAAGTVISTSQNVDITATDEYGNVKTCTFLVNLVDDSDPVISCPSNQSQVADAGQCSASINDYTSLVTWSDNCTTDANDMVFQQSPAPGSTVSGPDNVTMLVTDSSGNTTTCIFQLDIIDNEGPVLTCPSDFDVYTNSSCSFGIPDYTGIVTAVDNCSGIADLTFTQSPASGTILTGLGTVQTITMDVEDAAGNLSTCTFDITLSDSTIPTIICPTTQNVDADINCDFSVADYTSLATVGDNCSAIPALVVTQDLTPGTIVNKGTHSIQLTVEDERGNTASCSFDLEVADVTAPLISSCAPNQIEPVTASCEAALLDYSSLITVTDACDLTTDLVFTQSPGIGTMITGLTTVTLTVSDLSGNSSNCTFDVDVVDTISPVADCSADTTIAINSTCEYAAPDVMGLVLGTDNCSSFSNMTLSQNIAPGTTLSGAQLIDVTLTDENGNTNTCSVQVNVEDLIPPTITCPVNQTLNNGVNCNYQITDYTSLVTASDNCGAPTITQNPAAGTEIGVGVHVVEFTAEDASGNIATCSFVLTVLEFGLPTITCPTDISTCDPVVTYAAPVVVENCISYTLTQVDASGYSSGDAFPVGVTNQSYEVVDGSGNIASCSFNVEVFEMPDTAEIITLPTSFCEQTNIVLEATPPTSGIGVWTILEGGATLNNQFSSTTGSNNLTYGSNTFVWTVSTTSCGSSSDTVTIIVYQNPSQANTQGELTLCNDTLINIAATSPSVGTGTWSDVNGTASFLDTMAPNTVLFNLNEGWNEIVWTVSNGACLSTYDTINVFRKSNARIYSSDTTVCLINDGFQLFGSPIVSGVSGIWYVSSGGVEFENQGSSSPTVVRVNGGTNIIVYGQNHPVCGSTTDTLIIIGEQCGEYNPIIPTVITPNLDGKNDLFVIQDLHMLYPNAEVKIVNRWGNLVFESIGYEEPWNGTLMNEGQELSMGTYFYRILLNDSTNKEITGPISIIR